MSLLSELEILVGRDMIAVGYDPADKKDIALYWERLVNKNEQHRDVQHERLQLLRDGGWISSPEEHRVSRA